MEITFGSQIIKSYKRLSYTPWYAFAEFVDNSTESYLLNRTVLDGTILRVEISYNLADGIIRVEDNAMGMSEADLRSALIVGMTPEKSTGRSQYGLGMKTAACWLGNKWSVTTKKLGETTEHKIHVDVDAIANNDLDLHYETRLDRPSSEHYTVIEMTDLNRKFHGNTQAKIKNFLRSMYRIDFREYGFQLFWDGVQLEWDYDVEINNKLHRNRAGEEMKTDFEFYVGRDENKKSVRGWVGVFEQGSRKDAGFSVIQYDRVIKGWPDSYRPESVFGDNRNDLVNQRLVGEIFLKDFFVSHTKDEIIFENEDQDEFEAKLAEECLGYKRFAQEYRKYLDDERVGSPDNGYKALNEFEEELRSDILRDKIKINSVPPGSVIQQMRRNVVEAVMNRMPSSLNASLDELDILIYLDSQLSPNDPYVLTELSAKEGTVIVIINSAHPHWTYLSNSSAILNFIRHCTYDGVAEWKASKKLGRIDPDTIKYIKDDLLRVAFEIERRD